MIGKTIKELEIGDTAEFSKTVSESDIYHVITSYSIHYTKLYEASISERTSRKVRYTLLS